MPSSQKQTATQSVNNGMVTTTTVTTTAPAQQIVNQSLGSLGVIKSVERKIEERNSIQASFDKKPLNEILDKTLAVTFGKDKAVPDTLAFRSTNSIDELPPRVLQILTSKGITFNTGDRIIHTPGAYFFSLVKQIGDQKTYQTFSLNEPVSDEPLDAGDRLYQEVVSEFPEPITQPDSPAVVSQKPLPNPVDFPEQSVTSVSQTIPTSDTQPVEIVSRAENMGATPVGTLGTIQVQSERSVPEKNVSPTITDSRADDNLFTQAILMSNTSINTTTNSQEVSTSTDQAIPEPTPWSFTQEVVRGPSPEVTLEESIKQTRSFVELHDLIMRTDTFLEQPAEDVWMLIRNYTHKLISLDRIPREYGLQQQVDRLFGAWTDSQKLLELDQSEQGSIEVHATQDSSLNTLLHHATQPVDIQAQSVLESLGIAVPGDTQTPVLDIARTLPGNDDHTDQSTVISNTVDETVPPTVVEKTPEQLPTVSRQDLYQVITDRLYQELIKH